MDKDALQSVFWEENWKVCKNVWAVEIQEQSKKDALKSDRDSNSSDNDVRSLLLFQNKPLQILSYTPHY